MPGSFGRVIRDLMLRLVFRYLVTDRSTAWMYDHRVAWDQRLAAAPTPSERGSAAASSPVVIR
ncbi:MAG: hypothetical protein H0U86_06740 [Chloroflexi bacterium]|nr:hypothetical protein [Chloroflexota bacterium]